MEEWRDVLGYEGIYQVSSYGRVRSLDRIVHASGRKSYFIKGRYLSFGKHRAGYYQVNLSKNGVQEIASVHRLVALAFVEGYRPGLVVNHKDECVTNNLPSNLEWITNRENLLYGTCVKRHKATMQKQRGIKVAVYNSRNSLVGEFESIRDAALNVGVDHQTVKYHCDKGNKDRRGYYYKYIMPARTS